MPSCGSSSYKNYSKIRKHWENHYKQKGCRYNKIIELTFRKMRRLRLSQGG